ncbi:MAG: alkaline phosphatase family protein [Deltaproteobacteria bacterium]|nr:alkaline phosphatase family protein [Deltaproteobacteria bacterium]
MRPAHASRPARPLVIIGWDGATPELVKPWMADGTLPHLAQLAKRGAWSPLRSLLHPLSPAAWTSAFTGLNPGRHGIWDFGQLKPGTYEVAHTDASMRHGATLWDIAEDCGLRSVVMNVPLSHPAPKPSRGVFVPGLGADSLEDACWPRNLAGLIESETPGYAIDVNSYEHADPSEFLAALHQMVESRGVVAEALLRRERPDLFVCTFVATDRVQHAFWQQAALPTGDGSQLGWKFADAIKDVYVQLDAILGRLIHAAGPDAAVLVVSDHGFGDLQGDIYLNSVLEEMGLLDVWRPAEAPRGLIGSIAERILGRLPSALRRRDPGFTEHVPRFGDIRWEGTRAYARGLFGQVSLNLRGREPVGQVEPGPEADALLSTISERLLALRTPDGREPLIDAVFRGGELYEGPMLEEAPDLIVVPKDFRWMTRAGREIGPKGELFGPAAVGHTGNHRMNGVLVGAGPGIRPSDDLPLQKLLDLTPTALALLGIEVPRRLDGRPMTDLLGCDVGWTDELPWREPTGDGADPERLARQLEGLGYIAR